ncbi:MAG: helix-turn-helix transcriptional regulator, partial [Ktedonobacteraceae bacterium]|nr:helix-turn-helix transcriptional regulator [Ktedonobacteraceae bacterium]
MENRKLSQARAKKRWTIAKVCELTGISEKTYRRCERGTHKPHYHTIDRLCSAFNMTAEDLGFVDETNDLPANGTDVVTLTRDQINAIIHILQLGEDEMTHFDPTRRKAILQALLTASSVAVASPQILANPEPWDRLPRSITQPLDMSKEALEYFQQLINIGWHLSNASQDATVERMLPIFIPQLEAAAQQPSKNQQALCAIVAQGYILASEVDRNNIKAVEHYGKLAVRYSETSHDYNILVAALKQQATIASIA